MTDRKAYTDGLRTLADRLDANPDCPLPYDGNDQPVAVYVTDDVELRAAAKAFGGEKVADDRHGFRLLQTFGGLSVRITPLYSACERVEVGTTTETREVEVCRRCGAELMDDPDKGWARRCPSWDATTQGFRHDRFPDPQTKTVESSVPVYETRCPPSILAPVESYEQVRARTLAEDRGVTA